LLNNNKVILGEWILEEENDKYQITEVKKGKKYLYKLTKDKNGVVGDVVARIIKEEELKKEILIYFMKELTKISNKYNIKILENIEIIFDF